MKTKRKTKDTTDAAFEIASDLQQIRKHLVAIFEATAKGLDVLEQGDPFKSLPHMGMFLVTISEHLGPALARQNQISGARRALCDVNPLTTGKRTPESEAFLREMITGKKVRKPEDVKRGKKT